MRGDGVVVVGSRLARFIVSYHKATEVLLMIQNFAKSSNLREPPTFHTLANRTCLRLRLDSGLG